MPRTVPELTATIASGDPDALAEFYERYFDSMFRFARSETRGDEALCLDIVQDTVLRVVRSMRRLESEAHLERWLRQAVRHVARDRLRADRRRGARERAVPGARDPGVAAIDDRLAWLQRELEGLGDNERRLLVERLGFERTLRSIGQALGLAPGAVDGRVGRLVRLLRRRAREQFDES